jgi:4-hydroxyphenylpyruvate dioxygenase
VFQPLDDPESALREIIRVTRPRERVMALDPDHGRRDSDSTNWRIAVCIRPSRCRWTACGLLNSHFFRFRESTMATNSPSLWENPLGTDGFEFIEYAAPDPAALGHLFEQMGFTAIARHRSKNVLLYRQGEINFIVNAEPDSFAQSFARVHGPSICAIAFRVGDAAAAYNQAVAQGAWGVPNRPGPMELNIPAIKGIGDSLIYLVDRYSGSSASGGGVSIYDIDFVPLPGVDQHPAGAGLTYIDHLTHNVHRGRMGEWADFYTRIFNFREIRYFDIEGKLSGLKSKAMTSPCGKIRIPINESADDKSQIQEYLVAYHGEGIQHVALGTQDIFASVERLRTLAVAFQDTPDTYYDMLAGRLPGHREDTERLRKNRILLDGAPVKDEMLLQIFTATVIGPIFFEIIQRKGNEGFGEGNFQALFESIEQDQIRRGVL